MENNYINLPDNVKYAMLLKGLDENVVKKISYENNEPDWMLQNRLEAFKIFSEKPMPSFGPDISDLDFENIIFFAKPEAMEDYATSWEDVSPEIKEKFERLGIPEAERKYLAGAGGQYDSSMVYHKMKEKREQKGIIFEDMSTAVQKYPELVKKHFMNIVSPNDHKFAALHGAVWSGGTFIYIPEGVQLDEPLQAYFRMNTLSGGQFEHTLIIVEDNARGEYIEGCSAPDYNSRALHAGCVEITVGKNSYVRYSSVENRSLDTYNLNTKRAIIGENSFMEWVGGNLGSGKTMLYPMSILKGDNSRAEHFGVAMASSSNQVQDTGSKVVHIGKNTSSTIVTKSISKAGGINNYRGIVEVHSNADNAVNKTECDAILVDGESQANTVPYIKSNNSTATIAHEATSGKIDEFSMFYLSSRGIDEEMAASLIVNGFVSPIVKKLPLEYAGEMNKLIEMEMEGSVG